MTVEPMTQSCPRCDASVAPEAKFCANCGQALTEASTADAAVHTRVAAAAPAPLITKMRSARLTGERKPVTALFADVVGSTTLAEYMDPEDWTAMINEAFDLMSRAVFRYEGTIAQLQGDAMLAFFGAPVAHEDDPERAIFAALDMLDATAEFAAQLKATHGIDFRIRAGINSGPVMVGKVGSDLRYEYTALGDAVNVAARMQTAAQPGTVLVTEMTRRLTGDTFDLEDLGDIEVKGKTEPIHVYRVLGRNAAPGRRRGLASVGLDSPMVGRAEQLERLSSLLDVVSAGHGRAAFIVGEPGIGKSRLLAELKRAALSPPSTTRWFEGHCVSYGRGLPYHLLIDLLRSILGFSFAATEAEARSALDAALVDILGADQTEAEDTAPYLADLLGLPLRPGEAIPTQTPETLQGRYIAATHRLLRGLAARGPVVVVCEDLHWADPASIDVARQIMPLAAQLPILFVAALRAETDSPGWALIGHARTIFGEALTEIRLDPLAESDSRSLVANLLEIESLPDRVRDLILARAEGNPFFVEELVRMLIEGGVIVQEGSRWVATAEVASVEIPETLHGLLLARIDQLPDDAKRSLRVAAVIGRQFPVRVLERVIGAEA
ncbi:MAG TPA: adenylate/guanylate cyclase domain-containing protein [Patescibacteria group bacterium]|jgi:class 3 adenylate cyclase|nr:adenylate/guanylate cyclase domain-containing protein [Patescibacteria group bacterium]